MKTTNSLALVLSLVLGATAVGCGADPSAMPGDDGGGGGDDGGGGGGTTQPGPLDVTGKYTVHSTFDLATNMPGTAGDVVNTIIDATHGDDQPTHWILDQIISQLPNGTAKTVLKDTEGFVAGFLNPKILDLAPDFVSTMVMVGSDFGDIAKQFGLTETLELTGSGTNYTAIHIVTGAHFKLGNEAVDYSLADYHMQNVVVTNVAITMDSSGQLTIATHDVPLAYGQLLRLGLNAAIIPQFDSTAHNLNELFAHLIDCEKIGNAVADAIGFSSFAGELKAGCTAGLDVAAQYVYSKIDAIDGTALTFGLSGAAHAQDTNNDRKIDTIQSGSWSGTLTYGSTPTPLIPAAFTGART